MHRRGYEKVAILFLVVFYHSSSFAQNTDLAFSRNARTFETQQASLVSKSMAFACLSMMIVPDGLPCNPAFTPLRKSATLGVEGLISNGYSTLNTMQKILSGTVDQDLINTLTDPQKRVLQIEGNIEIDLMSQYLNARYTPASLKFFSVVRNESYPKIDLYAVQEDNYVFQTGYEFAKGLFGGLQFRSLERKFIKQEFLAGDLGTDAGKQLLTPENQSGMYLEPGIAYIYDSIWKPRVSAMLVNLGVQSGQFNDLKEPLEAQFSLGVTAPLKWGSFDFEVDYRSMTYEEPTMIERLHWGGFYHLGTMYLSGGVDYNGISGGIYYGLQQINAGIMYSTTQVPWRNEDYYTQTVYVQFGWQI